MVTDPLGEGRENLGLVSRGQLGQSDGRGQPGLGPGAAGRAACYSAGWPPMPRVVGIFLPRRARLGGGGISVRSRSAVGAAGVVKLLAELVECDPLLRYICPLRRGEHHSRRPVLQC